MVRNNKNKRMTVATLPLAGALQVKRSRRNRVVNLRIPRGLPNYYPNAPGDQITFDFKMTEIIEVPASTATATAILVLGVGTASTGISYLNNRSALFSANSQCYTKFMVSNLTVELRATGVGGTANTFVAASYIPSNTSMDGAPSGLNELSQSINYAESALGTVGRFNVKPCEYFNDWRTMSNADDNDKQCGLIQFYGSAGITSSGVSAGVMTISGTVHMCGLRF